MAEISQCMAMKVKVSEGMKAYKAKNEQPSKQSFFELSHRRCKDTYSTHGYTTYLLGAENGVE